MFGKSKHFLVCEHVLERGEGKVFVLTPARAEVREGNLGGAPPRHTARGVDSAYERGGNARRLP